MMTWTKRLLLAVTLLALLASNVLTITHSAFNAALSGFMATALGVRTVSGAMQTRLSSQEKVIRKHQAATRRNKAAMRNFGHRLTNRTRRVAAKSIAAIPAESIPFIGIAVLIADTGYELYAACETIRDLDQLYSDLGMAAEVPDDAMHGICNPELPDPDQVWTDVAGNIDQWWSGYAAPARPVDSTR